MTRHSGDRGKIVLEAVVVIFLATAGALFQLPRGESRTLLANEAGAVKTLQMLSRAQIRFRASRSPEDARFAFLPELLGDPSRWLDRTWTDPELGGRFTSRNLTGDLLEEGGYRFVMYVVDADDRPLRRPDEGRPTDGFWIAYAWPAEFGETGRRVFVADSLGIIRSWDNRLRTYTADTAPPAGLASAPDGESYPIGTARVGWRRTMRWMVEAGR